MCNVKPNERSIFVEQSTEKDKKKFTANKFFPLKIIFNNLANIMFLLESVINECITLASETTSHLPLKWKKMPRNNQTCGLNFSASTVIKIKWKENEMFFFSFSLFFIFMHFFLCKFPFFLLQGREKWKCINENISG